MNIRPISEKVNTADDWLFGEIMSIHPTYGFIRFGQGRSVFFHRDTCIDATAFKSFVVGTRVKFRLGKDKNGKGRADGVVPHQ